MSAYAHQIGHCDTFWADVEPFLNLSHPLLGFGRCTSWGSVKRAVQNFVPQNLEFVPRRYGRIEMTVSHVSRTVFIFQGKIGLDPRELKQSVCMPSPSSFCHKVKVWCLVTKVTNLPVLCSSHFLDTNSYRYPATTPTLPKSKLGLHGDAWLIPCQRMPRKKFSTCQSCYI